MARTYYKACLDKNETTDARGSEPLLEFIREIGGWNISGTFDASSWDFQRTLEILHNKYNRGGGLFSWAVGADEKNSTQNVLQLDQSGLILPTRDYYLNRTAHEKVIDAYLTYMVKVGVLLGGNESETRSQMEKVLEFETRIANVSLYIRLS
jgi:endothelin-converting enzyme